MTYLFFTLSACFGALTQLIVFEQYSQSWLPEWVLRWDLGVLLTADAYHVYQGLWLICFGIAFFRVGSVLLSGYISSQMLKWKNWFLKIYVRGFKIFGKFWRWVIVAGIIILYYQIYNLFYHIIFRYPEFWRWPIG